MRGRKGSVDGTLAGEFGASVHRRGTGRGVHLVRRVAVPGEHVVGGDVDQPGTHPGARRRQVRRTVLVHRPRSVLVRLRGVHRGVRGAVDHHRTGFDLRKHRVAVGDVELVRAQSPGRNPGGLGSSEKVPTQLSPGAGHKDVRHGAQSGTPIHASLLQPRRPVAWFPCHTSNPHQTHPRAPLGGRFTSLSRCCRCSHSSSRDSRGGASTRCATIWQPRAVSDSAEAPTAPSTSSWSAPTAAPTPTATRCPRRNSTRCGPARRWRPTPTPSSSSACRTTAVPPPPSRSPATRTSTCRGSACRRSTPPTAPPRKPSG